MIDFQKPVLKSELTTEEKDFKSMMEASRINLKSKPEKSTLAISIGIDDVPYNGYHFPLRFGTYGNISMIKGEEKARKSWLKSLLLGCCFGGNSNRLSSDIKVHNLNDRYVLDLDTEQDKNDSWSSSIRIPKIVGTNTDLFYPENYVPLNLREYSPKERRGFLEWLFMESEYKGKIGICSIDGYVDLVDDFNSNTDSIEITQALMKYSSIGNTHITGVLHLNPGSEKARGALGTILQQKCETVVVIKDSGEYSDVYCQRGRGKKFKPFKISVNSERLPYVLDVTDKEIHDKLNDNDEIKF